VETENGQYGLGASNVSQYVVKQTNYEALAEFTESNIQQFIGQDLNAFHSCIDKIFLHFKTVGARTALDIAFHDLFCKSLNISVAQFYGQKIKSLPTSVTIGIMSIQDTISEAQDYIKEGFKNLKVKLGESYDIDLERMIKLREAIGHSIKIRIDANQGWSAEETLKFYHDTKSLNIELVEQPMKVEMDDEMRKFPEALKKLIAADESLVSPKNALKLATDPKCAGIYNIKIMKCAGITKAREIAQIAQNANIDLMWGCNDESIISITAALHMALSCPNTKYLDLDGSFDLASDLTKGGFILEDGHLFVSEKPGFGFE